MEAFYEEVEKKQIPAFLNVENWKTEILNSFAFPYSNGFLGGVNNCTKVMKRNAYGFRRIDYFRAKIVLYIKY